MRMLFLEHADVVIGLLKDGRPKLSFFRFPGAFHFIPQSIFIVSITLFFEVKVLIRNFSELFLNLQCLDCQKQYHRIAQISECRNGGAQRRP